MGRLAKMHEQFVRDGVQIVAISADTPAQSRRLARSLRVPFPLLSDPGAVVADRYGVAMKGFDIAVPAVVVVRPDHGIHWRRVSETQVDRPDPQEVLRLARQAQTRMLTRRDYAATRARTRGPF